MAHIGFRIQDLGFRVIGFWIQGFRVQGLYRDIGFGIQGLRFYRSYVALYRGDIGFCGDNSSTMKIQVRRTWRMKWDSDFSKIRGNPFWGPHNAGLLYGPT